MARGAEQLRLRRLRNKAAASRSRAAKRELDAQREALLNELTLANAALHVKVEELTRVNDQLRLQLTSMQPDVGEDLF